MKGKETWMENVASQIQTLTTPLICNKSSWALTLLCKVMEVGNDSGLKVSSLDELCNNNLLIKHRLRVDLMCDHPLHLELRSQANWSAGCLHITTGSNHTSHTPANQFSCFTAPPTQVFPHRPRECYTPITTRGREKWRGRKTDRWTDRDVFLHSCFLWKQIKVPHEYFNCHLIKALKKKKMSNMRRATKRMG